MVSSRPSSPVPRATPTEAQTLFEAQRRAFDDAPVTRLRERRAQLRALRKMVLHERARLVDAVRADFGGRAPQEIELSEIFAVLEAIKHSERRLRRWTRPRPVRVSMYFQPALASIRAQPLGVVGIVSPWNYPLNLSLSPLQSAIAAGNRVLLKPSEHTPATSALLKELLESTLGAERVGVVLGDATVGAHFTRLPFDHLLFTGSGAVGRQVAVAAAEGLVPATLELGGKSPALLAPDRARSPRLLHRDAESIAYGKLLNAGQTCIAPDYALVPAAHVRAFRDAYVDAVRRLYPRLRDNPDYGTVPSARHRSRLGAAIDEAREAGSEVIEINPADEALEGSRKLAPTVVLAPPAGASLLTEEVFGPVLPVVPYDALEDAIRYIRERPHPLALYLFTSERATREAVLQRTSSGGVTINDTIIHAAEEKLPFGGVGASGIGAYRGRFGFETFSHLKPVFRRPFYNSARKLRPPYGRWIRWILRFVLR